MLTEEEQNSQEMPSGNDWEVISEEAYLEISRKQQNKQWILVWLNYQNYSAIMLKRKITARLEYIVYVNTHLYKEVEQQWQYQLEELLKAKKAKRHTTN